MKKISMDEERFLCEFFTRLAESGVYYAVMRNYEYLPESVNGSDLDILIKPADLDQFQMVLTSVLEDLGGASLGISNTLGFFKSFIFGPPPIVGEAWWGLRLDVNVGYSYKGINLLDMDKSDDFTMLYRGVWVLTPGIASCIGVLKEVLFNAQLPARYAVNSAKAIAADGESIQTQISGLDKNAFGLFNELVNTASPNECIKKKSLRLKRAIYVNSFKNKPAATIANRIYHTFYKIKRYVRPSGRTIAFLGVDGVGKSTVINELLPFLEKTTHGAVCVKHLRPTLFPPLSHFTKGENNNSVENPHGESVSGPFISLIRLSYLTVDYIIGYWLKSRVTLAISPTVIIYDRYCYDIKIDPSRFRIKLPAGLISFYLRFIPKPDLLFCLCADAEVILSRKQELTLAETNRQLIELNKLAAHTKSAHLINTEAELSSSIQEIKNIILNFYKKI